MRASQTKNGITLRVVAGTQRAILGIDLQGSRRAGCLGFSIYRTDLGPVVPFTTKPKADKKTHDDKKADAKPADAKPAGRWLPNMLRFPDVVKGDATTEFFPLQKFRWGDYTLDPAHVYKYRVVPRYGKPGALEPKDPTDPTKGVEVEVTTEDPNAPETAVFFNRGAAASKAFGDKFPNLKKEPDLLADTEEAAKARVWLSNGLEEGITRFLELATDDSFALHAAIYEFQKDSLLAALKAAGLRGADVQVTYHARVKSGGEDHTAKKNADAIARAKFGKAVKLKPRKADPQGAIMHNKFVVLLKKERGKLKPKAVLTGSTNWTDGGIYGQLNVAHAVHEEEIAAAYEAYFQLLHADESADTMKNRLSFITPVSMLLPGEHKATPVFSPQSDETMLHLYQGLCDGAKCLMVSAPFALSPIIMAAISKRRDDVLRFMLLDKMGSLGKEEMIHVIEGDPSNLIAAATPLKTELQDAQGQLLEGRHESFMHPGIHIHSKIILADPFGSDPILVTGSANFSHNSTATNDSNSLVIRGHTAVADIYATEFMRMFEHYHFRSAEEKKAKSEAKKAKGAAKKTEPERLALKPDDSWADKYYVPGSIDERDRRMFAGTS